MTKLMEQAVSELATLPESRQDSLAALVLEEVNRERVLAAIEEGEADVRAGRTMSQEEAVKRLARWQQ